MHTVSVPWILVICGTLVVVLAALYLIRQLVVAHQRGAFECTLQRRSLLGRRPTWQLGLMRYGTRQLSWYRAFSLRIRPEVTIARERVVALERLSEEPGHGGEPHVLLELRMADGQTRRMLLARSAASGLMAWMEAAPAGSLRVGTD